VSFCDVVAEYRSLVFGKILGTGPASMERDDALESLLFEYRIKGKAVRKKRNILPVVR
jgi:hypothetical protein